MRGDAAHSAHAREEKCYDPRSCPPPGSKATPHLPSVHGAGTARTDGKKSVAQGTARKSCEEKCYGTARKMCEVHGTGRSEVRAPEGALRQVRVAYGELPEGAFRCELRTWRNSIAILSVHLCSPGAPGACLRTWRLSAHLAPVCAPGACLLHAKSARA